MGREFALYLFTHKIKIFKKVLVKYQLTFIILVKYQLTNLHIYVIIKGYI